MAHGNYFFLNESVIKLYKMSQIFICTSHVVNKTCVEKVRKIHEDHVYNIVPSRIKYSTESKISYSVIMRLYFMTDTLQV